MAKQKKFEKNKKEQYRVNDMIRLPRVILIDHNLEEVLSMSDRVAVLFQGRIVDVVDAEDVTRDDVVSMMVSGQSTREEGDDEPLGRQADTTSSSSSTA